MTMVELTIYALISSVVGLVTYSLLRTSTILGAKNSNINQSHNELRGVFDRVADHLLGSNNVASLIGSDGLPLATQVGSNAPGLKFDRVIGEPYLLHPWQSCKRRRVAARQLHNQPIDQAVHRRNHQTPLCGDRTLDARLL